MQCSKSYNSYKNRKPIHTSKQYRLKRYRSGIEQGSKLSYSFKELAWTDQRHFWLHYNRSSTISWNNYNKFIDSCRQRIDTNPSRILCTWRIGWLDEHNQACRNKIKKSNTYQGNTSNIVWCKNQVRKRSIFRT